MASKSCIGEGGERGMLFHFSFTLFRSRSFTQASNTRSVFTYPFCFRRYPGLVHRKESRLDYAHNSTKERLSKRITIKSIRYYRARLCKDLSCWY